MTQEKKCPRFQYLITVTPLGLMYGSAGGFLSPENLVGLSRSKFPPEAATLSGLIFSSSREKNQTKSALKKTEIQKQLRDNLYVAGPFWAKIDAPEFFYVPIPWTKIISDDGCDEWFIKDQKWHRQNSDLEPEYQWQTINSWNHPPDLILENENAAKPPWKFIPMLHPDLETNQRHVKDEDGLFLEYAVQMEDDTCIVYLSTEFLESGWYRFGGENHVVEINSIEIPENDEFFQPFRDSIQQAFALITPAVWGSTRFSYRYPQSNFPISKMLTDKPIPYRYRTGDGKGTGQGRLGRGRYAVPPGSVYVLDKPLNQTWRDWDESWFPQEGYSLRHVGCGLSLPLKIQGVTDV